MFEKISRFMTDYKIQKRRIDENTTFKKSAQATLGALLLTVLIYLIPMLLVYNLMIFPYLKWLIFLMVFVIFFGFAFTYHIIYIKIIKNYYEKLEKFNFKKLVIVEASIVFIILAIFTTIFISLF